MFMGLSTVLRQKRNNSLIKDFLLLCKDREDSLKGIRNKSLNKRELVISNMFINIKKDCELAPWKYCNNGGKFELFAFTIS